MHFNVYDVFYLLCPHQHVLAAIPAIFRALLLQEYRNTIVVSCVAVTL